MNIDASNDGVLGPPMRAGRSFGLSSQPAASDTQVVGTDSAISVDHEHAFHEAVKCADPMKVDQLLCAGVSVNARDAQGNTVLHLMVSGQGVLQAALEGMVGTIVFKHLATTDLYAVCNAAGDSALCLAVRHGHTNALQRIIAHMERAHVEPACYHEALTLAIKLGRLKSIASFTKLTKDAVATYASQLGHRANVYRVIVLAFKQLALSKTSQALGDALRTVVLTNWLLFLKKYGGDEYRDYGAILYALLSDPACVQMTRKAKWSKQQGVKVAMGLLKAFSCEVPPENYDEPMKRLLSSRLTPDDVLQRLVDPKQECSLPLKIISVVWPDYTIEIAKSMDKVYRRMKDDIDGATFQQLSSKIIKMMWMRVDDPLYFDRLLLSAAQDAQQARTSGMFKKMQCLMSFLIRAGANMHWSPDQVKTSCSRVVLALPKEIQEQDPFKFICQSAKNVAVQMTPAMGARLTLYSQQPKFPVSSRQACLFKDFQKQVICVLLCAHRLSQPGSRKRGLPSLAPELWLMVLEAAYSMTQTKPAGKGHVVERASSPTLYTAMRDCLTP